MGSTSLRVKHAEYAGWKVFKCHTYTDEIGSEFDQQNAKGVYVFRDPRDVFASWIRKNSTTFEHLWRQGVLEDCLHNFQKWTSLSQVVVSKYEELITDLPAEVQRIAVHLGISLDRKEYQRIASSHTIERQQERIEESVRTSNLQQGDPNGPLFDPHTLLHTDHINSGEIGAWKGVLTPRQAALVESKARNWLISNGCEVTNRQPNLIQRTFSKLG